jgi:hypothetical protein
MTTEVSEYPVKLEIDYPTELSRGLIFVKSWLLAIPHYFALVVLGIVALFVLIASWFAVLFTGVWPRGMFDYVVGVIRWSARVGAYIFLLTDAYPPFSLDDDPNYPVRVQIDYPEEIPRWAPVVNWLLIIPYAFLGVLILYAAGVAVLIAWFAILFTGKLPRGLFDFISVALRWNLRATGYRYWMTATYPPFVFE